MGGTGIPYEKKGYTNNFNKKLRNKIRKRDNFKCQFCGLTQEEHFALYKRVLHVHHIDYNKKNCDEENLISLCIPCHMKTNFNRDYWINKFKIKYHHTYDQIS